MSRIGSVLSSVKNAAQAAAQKAEEQVETARQELAPKAPPPVKADAFEAARSASSLYDAGADRPGRQTYERTLTQAATQHFEGRRPDGRREVDDSLSGARLRLFAQRAQTVVSAGGDVFVGARGSEEKLDAHGNSDRDQLKLGAEAHGAAFLGTVCGASAGAQAGLELSSQTVRREALGDGLEVKHEDSEGAFYGVLAKGGAQGGTVTGASIDVFAGARNDVQSRQALVQGDDELGAVGVRGNVMIGFGAKADLEGGYDVDSRQLRVSGGLGGAAVVGAYLGGEATIGGPDEAPGNESARATDLLRGSLKG